MRHTHTAGGVVVGPHGKVLVVSQHGDSWSLPKGHIDPGENARQAAEREIWEESGIRQLTFVRELGEYQRYKIGKGGIGDDTANLKTITMFLYTTPEITLAPQDPANPEARWVAADEVAALLTHPKDRAFFEGIAGELAELA